MLQFKIDENKCTQCGLCALDCPVKIIDVQTGLPKIIAEKEGNCLKCQHCLAICPHAALSILGRDPQASEILAGNYPTADNLEVLIKGRRSVRHYKNEGLDADLLQRLLHVAWHAPTGVNMNAVQFTVIADKDQLNLFREETYALLAELVETKKLPQERAMFASFVKLWQEKGIDVLFRDAPHFVVATVPKHCPTPVADSIIALSYFDLFAQSLGVGTLWNGLLKWAIDELVPVLRIRLGIDETSLVGYVMTFGKPAIAYQRTIEKGPARINFFDGYTGQGL